MIRRVGPERDKIDVERYRAQIKTHLSNAEKLEILAAHFGKDDASAIDHPFVTLLEAQIDRWTSFECWQPLGAEAVANQAKALRSKELLEYLKDAEVAAEHHRNEAKRISDFLEVASDMGRIPKITEA